MGEFELEMTAMPLDLSRAQLVFESLRMVWVLTRSFDDVLWAGAIGIELSTGSSEFGTGDTSTKVQEILSAMTGAPFWAEGSLPGQVRSDAKENESLALHVKTVGDVTDSERIASSMLLVS